LGTLLENANRKAGELETSNNKLKLEKTAWEDKEKKYNDDIANKDTELETKTAEITRLGTENTDFRGKENLAIEEKNRAETEKNAYLDNLIAIKKAGLEFFPVNENVVDYTKINQNQVKGFVDVLTIAQRLGIINEENSLDRVRTQQIDDRLAFLDRIDAEFEIFYKNTIVNEEINQVTAGDLNENKIREFFGFKQENTNIHHDIKVFNTELKEKIGGREESR
jgi:hypothetical protein